MISTIVHDSYDKINIITTAGLRYITEFLDT